MIFVSTQPLPEVEIIAKAVAGSRHIFSQPPPDFESQRSLAEILLAEPWLFFEEPFKFVGALASPQPELFSLSISMKSSLEKINVLRKLELAMQKAGSRLSVIENVMTCADELILNAFFNAPVNSAGKPVYRNLPRTEDVRMSDDKSVLFEASMKGSHLLIGCRDDYGSLHLDPLLAHLRMTYESHGLPDSRSGTVGAGIGLKMVFDRATSFWIFAQTGFKTCVYAAFDLKSQSAGRKSKSLHLFEGDFHR